MIWLGIGIAVMAVLLTYHAKSSDLTLELPMDPVHGTVGVASAALGARSALVPTCTAATSRIPKTFLPTGPAYRGIHAGLGARAAKLRG